ncbi:MAG: cyclic nucleotide-binding domain-containing protein [Acidobacteriota bacterium]
MPDSRKRSPNSSKLGEEERTRAYEDEATRLEAPSLDAEALYRELSDRESHSLIDDVVPKPGAHLEFLGSLAEGGMGRVDIVRDLGLRRRIAKKVIGSELLDQSAAVRLFLREAQITAQLDHPAIVPVHEIGLDDAGHPFFTMKLVQGRTFDEWAGRGRPLPRERLPELIEVVVKLCDALAFAHDRGVTHGDLKPANVMIGDYGEAFLMDWGLARLHGEALERTSEVLRSDRGITRGGTATFMASEQALGLPMDARTDVFGAGALLYFALRGHPPFQGETLQDCVEKARRAEFAPLPGPEGTAPRDLVRIVHRAMERSPADRFSSVQELGEELRVFLRGGADLPKREFAAGEYVLRQGDGGDEVFVLVSGRVRFVQEIDSKTIERGEAGPGAVFGEMAMLVDSPRTASAIALEDCVVRVITGETLESEVGGMKPWLVTLVRTLAQRLRSREEEEARREPDAPSEPGIS